MKYEFTGAGICACHCQSSKPEGDGGDSDGLFQDVGPARKIVGKKQNNRVIQQKSGPFGRFFASPFTMEKEMCYNETTFIKVRGSDDVRPQTAVHR